MAQYFYDKQIRKYIQQFIRLFGGFDVQMGVNDQKMPIYQTVPVRYGDTNRMASHITRENSENVINTVPFIACYVTSLDMAPERRMNQQHVDKVQVYEKARDEVTGEYTEEVGNRYTVERHMPVPYNLTMNCDIWTSNTDQKLQLLEQIMVLFNPTLNIHTTDNPLDWSSLAYVEMKNSQWSSRSVGASVDDIIDVSTLTFEMPIFINPPAKLKQQKLIYTVINQLYSLDDVNLDAFDAKEAFDTSSLQYVTVSFDDMKIKFDNDTAYLYNASGTDLDANGVILDWKDFLTPFGELREGISQIRMRKSSAPNDMDNDIIGRLSFDANNANALIVDIDTSTLPSNTLTAINGVLDPSQNYPGDGSVSAAVIGDRYLINHDIPSGPLWAGLNAYNNDIIEYNGSIWTVSFDNTAITTQQYVENILSGDQLEWNGTEWINSHEGIYNAGFWRLYL
jgi:hypothetical protein